MTDIEVRKKEPNELIVIKQLPVIEEHLQTIGLEIQAQRDEALSLEATEENLALIRVKRAELNKTFSDLEARRIAVKKAILAPYDTFEEMYKTYITDIHKPTDEELKKRIDSVGKIVIDEKTDELKAYFREAIAEKEIDFVTFDSLGLKINRSASVNKLKTQIDEELERVAGDIAVIATMEHSAEILVEYKQNHDLAQSVLEVNTRKERLAAEFKRQKEAEQAKFEAEQKRKAELEARQRETQVTVFTPPTPAPEVAIDFEVKSETAQQEMPFEPMPFELEEDDIPPPTTVITVNAYVEEQIQAVIDVCNEYGLEYTKEVVSL